MTDEPELPREVLTKSHGSALRPTDPGDPLRPKKLPAIRDWLSKTCEKVSRSSEFGFRLVRWEANTLKDPDLRLVYVAPEMTELLCRVAHTVPDGINLDEIPRPLSGLALFAHPVVGTDASNSRTIEVHGQMWGPVHINDRGVARSGLSIATIGHVQPSDEFVASFHSTMESGYLPLGRTDWMDDETIEVIDRGEDQLTTHAVENKESFKESAIEDRRLFVALVTLMNQERHVEQTTWKPMSKSAKRRLGNHAEVTVVQLRRSSHDSDLEVDETADSVGGKWKVRAWVSPHFRMQPYGPNRSLRRLQLIEGHMKGPEGAPLSKRQRVWSLKR
jgi:hypothetical protein